MQVLLELLGRALGLLDWVIYLARLQPTRFRAKFFSHGYGDPSRAIQENERIYETLRKSKSKVPDRLAIGDRITWGKPIPSGNLLVTTAHFPSPLARFLPEESKNCRFYHVQPLEVNKRKPIVLILLPGTGETGKRERLRMARQLADERGISSVIVTAPLYAARKPQRQRAFFVRTVEEIMFQGTAIMTEASALACYFLELSPNHKICLSGFSWGAAMSAGAAMMTLSCQPDGKRLACVPFVGCGSPNIIADGVLESVVVWSSIQNTTNEPYRETRDCLFRKLSELSFKELRELVVEQKKSLGALRLVTMTNDQFIGAHHSKVFSEDVLRVTSSATNIMATQLLGGHVVAAVVRPWYQKQAILEAIEALQL